MFHDAPVEAAVVVHRHKMHKQADPSAAMMQHYRIPQIVDFIIQGGGRKASPFMRVALQFPDAMLDEAVAVVHLLTEALHQDPNYRLAIDEAMMNSSCEGEGACVCAGSGSRPAEEVAVKPIPRAATTLDNPNAPVKDVRLFVLADNTFGSCCPDEITAEHYHADCIVHFGAACMSKTTRLPVLYVQPSYHLALAGAREAEVVAGVVCGVRQALERRLELYKQHCEKEEDVNILLSVVCTYACKSLTEKARALLTASDGASQVRIAWPVFEQREGVAAMEEKGTASGTSWVVNGVRFDRLSFASPPADEVPVILTSPTLQYFLFFGEGTDAEEAASASLSTSASSLVQTFAAEQYNQFHYPEACKRFLEWEPDSDEDLAAVQVPLLSSIPQNLLEEEENVEAREWPSSPIAAVQVATEVVRKAWQRCGGVSSLYTGACGMAQSILQRRVRQRGFNIETIRASSAIGILVASLAIEGYYALTQVLHQYIRACGKRSYIIYVGHLNEFKLANFVDSVDCFVAIACPNSRESHYPEKKDGYMKPVVSPAEVLVALSTSDDMESVEQYGMAAVYSSSFDMVLAGLQDAVAVRAARTQEQKESDAQKESEAWLSSGALVHVGGGGGALSTVTASQGALSRLYEREYVGLETRLGETPVQSEIVQGKHGIARGYATERGEAGP